MLNVKTIKSLIEEMMESSHISKELIEVAARSGRIEKELNLLLHMTARARGFHAHMGGKLNGVTRIDEVINDTAIELKQRYIFDHPKFIGQNHFDPNAKATTSTFYSEMLKDIKKLETVGEGYTVMFVVELQGDHDTYIRSTKKLNEALENEEITIEILKDFYRNTPVLFENVVEEGILKISSTMNIHFFISKY